VTALPDNQPECPARGDLVVLICAEPGHLLDRWERRGYIRRAMMTVATIFNRRRRPFRAAMAFDRI
jgi:hypothetical protein